MLLYKLHRAIPPYQQKTPGCRVGCPGHNYDTAEDFCGGGALLAEEPFLNRKISGSVLNQLQCTKK